MIPIGFAWALFLPQVAHKRMALSSTPNITDKHRIQARRPPPRFSDDSANAILVYADNARHFAVCAQHVNGMRGSLSVALDGRGLRTHEILEATDIAESMGAAMDDNAGLSCFLDFLDFLDVLDF